MFSKNTKLIKAAFFWSATGLFVIPIIVSAQFTISGPSTLTNSELDVVLEGIIVGILGFIGIIGIIFLVYGGLKYVTSSGDDSAIEDAKKIITYSIIGLFVVVSAYAIVKTVVSFAS